MPINLGAQGRNDYIGGTDAKRILDGDWHTLWLEKTGRAQPADLSTVWKAVLGKHTEQLHADWVFRQRPSWERASPEVRLYHDELEFMGATIDSLVRLPSGSTVPLEVKHSYKRPIRECAAYYAPQLQHQMFVCGTQLVIFSMIGGNDEPEQAMVERNDEFITNMVTACKIFWSHVTNDTPPEMNDLAQAAIAATEAALPTIKVDGKRDYDMTGNNLWADAATSYLVNQPMAKLFDEAKAALKELVPADAATITGHGITISRDARGALRFK